MVIKMKVGMCEWCGRVRDDIVYHPSISKWSCTDCMPIKETSLKQKYYILFENKNIGSIDSYNDKDFALEEWLDNIPKMISIMLRRIIEEDKNSIIIKTASEYENIKEVD